MLRWLTTYFEMLPTTWTEEITNFNDQIVLTFTEHIYNKPLMEPKIFHKQQESIMMFNLLIFSWIFPVSSFLKKKKKVTVRHKS